MPKTCTYKKRVRPDGLTLLDAGLTQKEVAEKLGVAQAQYARWENGGKKSKKRNSRKVG